MISLTTEPKWFFFQSIFSDPVKIYDYIGGRYLNPPKRNSPYKKFTPLKVRDVSASKCINIADLIHPFFTKESHELIDGVTCILYSPHKEHSGTINLASFVI